MSAQPERFCSHFCKRLVGMVLLAGIVAFLSPLAARAATIASPPIGSWNAGSALSQPRAGGCSTLLQDGRILVIGGDNGFGPSPSVDFVSGTDGSISPAPPLLVARERHVCVTLQDGRVLVAGGAVSGGGVTNEAEVYDPIANSWST